MVHVVKASGRFIYEGQVKTCICFKRYHTSSSVRLQQHPKVTAPNLRSVHHRLAGLKERFWHFLPSVCDRCHFISTTCTVIIVTPCSSFCYLFLHCLPTDTGLMAQFAYLTALFWLWQIAILTHRIIASNVVLMHLAIENYIASSFCKKERYFFLLKHVFIYVLYLHS